MHPTTEQAIEQRASKAPRVTKEQIEGQIESEHYFTAGQGVDGADLATLRAADPNESVAFIPLRDDVDVAGTKPMGQLSLLTFCVLVLRNGFTVTGESACASPENFDAEIGKRIARDAALSKCWPLFGFQLREILHQQADVDAGN